MSRFLRAYGFLKQLNNMKKFDIWMEGFCTTGQSQGAFKVAEGYGGNFDEAVEDYIAKTKNHGVERNDRSRYMSDEAYENRRSNWYIWGCALFDNEADARKSFG